MGIAERRSIESDPCERWRLGNQEGISRERERAGSVAKRKFQSASNRGEGWEWDPSNLNLVTVDKF